MELLQRLPSTFGDNTVYDRYGKRLATCISAPDAQHLSKLINLAAATYKAFKPFYDLLEEEDKCRVTES